MGRSPRVIPLLRPSTLATLPNTLQTTGKHAADVICEFAIDVFKAQDNLLKAKVSQADHANRHRSPEDVFIVGEKFDGPYTITQARPTMSTYTLDMPNASASTCCTFHASLLARHCPNDDEIFLGWACAAVKPVIKPDGTEEFVIDCIIDKKRWGKGWRYLVQWKGMGLEEDEWKSGRELDDTEALDWWLISVGRLNEDSKGGRV